MDGVRARDKSFEVTLSDEEGENSLCCGPSVTLSLRSRAAEVSFLIT